MPRARCDVEYNGFAATRARAFARDTLRVWHLDNICLEAEMVTTELVTNAVLHGEPPISLELIYQDDLLRIAVGDYSAAPPVPGRPQSDAMTGRGLALVAAVSAQWGVVPPAGSASGKQVWAEFSTAPGADGEAAGGLALGVDELLDQWDDAPSDVAEERYEIVLGDVPTDLLVAAKAHVDNIVRELTLASYEPADAEAARPAGQLSGHLADLVRDVVVGFAEARQSIKRQALAAAARGDDRTRLSLTVAPALADAGERYLAALDDLDEYARAARLLTLETPPAHRAFRYWYVRSLVDQLRARAVGKSPPEPISFERFLLGEVASIESAHRVSDRAARLQRIAAALAGAFTPRDVARVTVAECAAAVGASGGAILLAVGDGDGAFLADADGLPVEGGGRGLRLAGGMGEIWPDPAAEPVERVFSGGRAVWIENTATESAAFERHAEAVRALCAVPLSVGGQMIGALAVSFATPQIFDADLRSFFEAVAAEAAQTLTRTRLHEEQVALARRLARLQGVAGELARRTDVAGVCQAAVRHVRAAVDATVVAVCLPTPDGKRLRLVETLGGDAVEQETFREFSIDGAFPASEAFRRQAPVVVDANTWQLPQYAAFSVNDHPLVCLPLRAHDGVAGVLTISFAPGRKLSQAEIDFLAAVADVCAQGLGRAEALQEARLFRQLQDTRQTELGDSYARLELALSAASIGSFDMDLTTGTVAWDQRMFDIWGIPEMEFDGSVQTIAKFVVEGDRETFDTMVSQASARIGDFALEFRIRRPEGTVRWVDSRGRVLPGPDGRPARAIGMTFDSTELRDARDRVARTLEHMADAFFSLDAEWRVTYMNAAAERLVARERNGLLGRVIWEAAPDLVADDEPKLRKARENQLPVIFERYIEATGRHFEVRAQPMPEGLGVYYTDVSQSRQFERERAELREASRHARTEAEVARGRLAFIAEVSADITTTLDATEVCQRLAEHAVSRLADWVSIYMLEGGQCHRVAAAHRDPDWAGTVASLVDAFPIDISSNAMVARAARTGVPVLEQHMTEQLVADTYPDPAGRALVEGMGVASAFVTPMIARGEIVGVIALVRAELGDEFDPDELKLAVTLASRAALAVQNARLYARQTTVAQALQQAVLPEALPSIDGVDLSARYEPALGGAGVGGDFYDVFRLPSGRIALAVGDAAGHGLQSGALMGQLRNALRAYAVLGGGPAATLRSLSELIAGLEPDAFATAFYAELDPATGELGWASAGHPPPLLTFPDASPRYFDADPSPPLGIVAEIDSGVIPLTPGAGILVYTDGLIERRHTDISDGLARLREIVEGSPADALSVDAIVRAMREGTVFMDDVCALLAVRSA